LIFPRSTICGVEIHAATFEESVTSILAQAALPHKMKYVVTPNAAHVVLLQKDERFRRVYDDAFLVVPDGVPLIWAGRLLDRTLPERVNGTDLFEALCAGSAERHLRVFLLGGREGAAAAAAAVLMARHPALEISDVYSPPFGFERDAAECENVVARVNRARPDLLFVGLGAPKQEYWMFDNRDRLDVGVALGIGVSFEFVGGVVRRAPRWMQRAGLEWLFRLVMEPARLWKRYVVGNMQFCFLVARQLLSKRH
jgi:N-acetylglucosaminyldiphosphoundecaprenol N-acetyl-beta-D-mannosaminyltransferase